MANVIAATPGSSLSLSASATVNTSGLETAANATSEAGGTSQAWSLSLVLALLSLLCPLGLALLEAGLVTRANRSAATIITKPLLQMFIVFFCYWSLGIAFANGSSTTGFAGTEHFFFNTLQPHLFPQWLFQAVMAFYCVAVASFGGVERNRLLGDIIVAVVISLLVHPIAVHWCWNEQGWLKINGFSDFAGAGVIHLTGGSCSLVVRLLSTRKFFVRREGQHAFDGPSHHDALVPIGAVANAVGLLAMQMGAAGDHPPEPSGEVVMAAVVLNAALAMACGAVAALAISKVCVRKVTGYRLYGGMVSGLVCISAGTDTLYPWMSLILGLVGGVTYILVRNAVALIKHLDDPMDVTAIHLAPAIIGLHLVPFVTPEGIFFTGSEKSGYWLAYNSAGCWAMLAWSAVLCLVPLAVAALLGKLSFDQEKLVLENDIQLVERTYMMAERVEDTMNNNNINNTVMNFSMRSAPLMASTQKELKFPRLVLETPREANSHPMAPTRRVPSYAGNHSKSRIDIEDSEGDVSVHISGSLVVSSPPASSPPGPPITREAVRDRLQSLRHTDDLRRHSLEVRRKLTPDRRRQSNKEDDFELE